MQTITLPAGQKNLEGLILLTAGLERLTGGGKIEIREAIVIETENMPAYWALQDILAKDYMMKALPSHGHAAELIETILSKPVAALEDHSRQDDKLKHGQVRAHEMAERHTKPRKKAKASPVIESTYGRRHQVKAWKVTACAIGPLVGKVFTGQEVEQRLKRGDFLPGTHFYHPKHGRMIVNMLHELIMEQPGKKKLVQIMEQPGKKKPARTRTDNPYTFLDGPRSGQTITGGALGRMLKAGNLAAGARLSHPKRGELVVVTDGANVDGDNIFTLQAVQP